MEFIIEGFFVLGGIILLITLIKYRTEIGKSVFKSLLSPFYELGEILTILFLPFALLIIFVEEKLEVNFLSKYVNKLTSSKRKTEQRKTINFQNFKKYIIVNSISEKLEDEIKKAEETCPEVDIKKQIILRTDEYSIVELPEIEFHGYNILIQWLTDNLIKGQTFGFSSNGKTKFLLFSETDNYLKGVTNSDDKFWVSLYDDLNKKQFLRINKSLKLKDQFTINKTEELINKAI